MEVKRAAQIPQIFETPPTNVLSSPTQANQALPQCPVFVNRSNLASWYCASPTHAPENWDTMAFVSSTGAVAPSASHSTRAVCERHSSFTPSIVSNIRATVPSSRRSSPRMVFGQTVKESLYSANMYKTFIKLADVAGVDLDVSNCTVFAPNDAAFARASQGYVEQLMSNPTEAAAVIARHILPGSVLTSKQIKGFGFWENIPGGPLSYEGWGAIVRVGNATMLNECCNNECDNGTIHTMNSVIAAPTVKPEGVARSYVPSIPAFSDSTVGSVYQSKASTFMSARSLGACLPSTTGGRKAMGLVSQLPFWMYGPPYNAAKQEEYEPISIAQPDGASVDYQLMPPGSVIVTPDETSAAKLNPVSGMSKYIGKTQRLVGGDGLSDYSRLPY